MGNYPPARDTHWAMCNDVAKTTPVSAGTMVALRSIDKRWFMPDVDPDETDDPLLPTSARPYVVYPWSQPIAPGSPVRFHHSSPSIYAWVLDGLHLAPGAAFLNLGSGTGWLSTIAASLVGPAGASIGVELHPELVAFARSRVARVFDAPDVDSSRLCRPFFAAANLRAFSLPSPLFDAVYIGTGLAAIPPNIASLVKPGGSLVAAVGNELVFLTRVDDPAAPFVRTGGIDGVAFAPAVPLDAPPPGSPDEAAAAQHAADAIIAHLAASRPRTLQYLAIDVLRAHHAAAAGVADHAFVFSRAHFDAFLADLPLPLVELLNGDAPLDVRTCAAPGCLARFPFSPDTDYCSPAHAEYATFGAREHTDDDSSSDHAVPPWADLFDTSDDDGDSSDGGGHRATDASNGTSDASDDAAS